MTFPQQFRLILWKNFVLQKRKPCVTVFEIIVPVALAALLIIIRSVVKTSDVTEPEVYGKFVVDPRLSYFNERVFLFAPDNPAVRKLMDGVVDLTKAKGIPFKDENALLLYFEQMGAAGNISQLVGGVIIEGEFPQNGSLPDTLTARIRPTTTNNEPWETRLMYPFFRTSAPRTKFFDGGKPNYNSRRFLSLECALVYAMIGQLNSSAAPDLKYTNLFLNMMPYPAYHNDPFLIVLQQFFPLFIVLSFILNALQTTKSIVHEKERKLKESMKMMGLSTFAHWSAWFSKCFLYLLITMVIFTVLCLIPVGQLGISVTGNSDPSLFFVFLIVYSVSVIAYCFAISTLFSKALPAAAASGIMFFLTYLPYFFLQQRYEYMTIGEKIAACLLPNIAMAFGCNVIALYEGTGEGAQWSNFHRSASIDDNFSLLMAMGMMLLDAVILSLITWYVDAVFPGEFGVPQPWYFPVLKSYWCGTKPSSVDSDLENGLEENPESEFFEKEPTGLVPGVQIKALRKEFGSGSGKSVAVAGTNLNMYRGQITVLLGHNGAGKTTTMSMLTGFLPPTSGTAVVNGYDIRKDIPKVRETLGLCPQHDILFDSLTVEEHLEFFARLKSHPPHLVKEEVDHIIQIVGLSEKADTMSSKLSGGQKRKLSVGIALVAGSQIIILDEPTSGMDPQARRQMWTILQKFKKNRTILLTTHFMDEADVLGDRIAIMAEGVVKCCGTSLFLKNKYGSGYHLTLVKKTGCDVRRVTNLITDHIPSAKIDSDVGAELTFILSNDESHKFEQLFTDLQSRMDDLGVGSFGMSVTTMEEVFLRVGESATGEADMPNELHNGTVNAANSDNCLESPVINGHQHDNAAFQQETEDRDTKGTCVGNTPDGILHFNQNLEKNTGLSLGAQQFKAAFVKKMLHTWRNRIITSVQLILPIAFTILALFVDMTSKIIQVEPPLTLDMSLFRQNYVPTLADNSTIYNRRLASCFNQTLEGTASIGTLVDSEKYRTLNPYYVDLGGQIGVSLYNREYIIGAYFDATSPSFVNINAFFNGQLYHSIAISLTNALNAFLKFHTNPLSSITVINHPLPEIANENVFKSVRNNSFLAFVIAFCIIFGMAFLSSSFVMFLIREKSTQSKHIQIVCGLRRGLFWMSNFAWDYVNYLIPCACLLVVFAAFGTEEYTGVRLGYVLIVLLLFGWAVLPFIYTFHFLFSTPASGFVFLSVLNIFTGLGTLLAVVVMGLPTLGTADIAQALDWIFAVLLPNYCLGQSFWSLFINYEYISACEKMKYKVSCLFRPEMPCCKGTCKDLCFPFQENYFSWDKPGIGKYTFFMAMQGFVYFGFVLLVEYGIARRLWYCIRPPPEICIDAPSRDEDSDVAAERVRVTSTDTEELCMRNSLVLDNVSKSYDGFVAVERLSLGIPQNECFGLLGVNGAGKTSTFKMLTGDEIISDGNAWLNGHDVKMDITAVQANLGYCPQFDALIDQMTGRETLTMFARLKGIREYRIPTVVNELMKLLTLEQYADRLAGKYSGGNKRKLSTAISLIGDPPVIFLDEPTTGVDPAARRQLWNVLSEVRASGRTLILTSHSMEECDALCTRIAIMVNGRFLCLGSPQHLKNKFGKGYSLIARMSDFTDRHLLQDLLRFIETTFPDHERVDAEYGYVNYHLKDTSVPLAFIFGALEKAKERYGIEDYSVSQTSLQQLFVDFARKQVPPREDKSGGFCKRLCCCCCSS